MSQTRTADVAASSPPATTGERRSFDLYFCRRCGACCRWPGYVHVTPAEIEMIAAHLGLTVEDFTCDFTRLTGSRHGLSLTEKGDGSCVFLDGVGCRIQAVKPEQCRAFPHRWRFEGFEKVCATKILPVTLSRLKNDANASSGE